MQHEITRIGNLLDGNNNLIEAGYCKKLLPIYNKKTDFSSRFHTKEWDYYLIINPHFALALTLADNGYMGLDSISFLDFDHMWEITKSPMQFMTLGKKNFPSTSETGDVEYGNDKYHITFENHTISRHLYGFMKDFRDGEEIEFDVTLTHIPEESMVICTPFEKKGHFYFNQKINCMVASGIVKIGASEYTFETKDSSAVLDWGRGIWTYSNTWFWSSLNTYIEGIPFGFNLGYGFGDTSAASENMLFYNGKAHKLESVDFGIPSKDGKDDFMSPWHFTSSDNRITMTFESVLDRCSCTNVGIIESDQHQVFGRFTGKCELDDGTIIEFKEKMGFAEKVKNRW